MTAYANSPTLNPVPVGDGTNEVILSDGTKINLDSTPPADPTAGLVLEKPPTGTPFNGVVAGQFSVSPSGAATYTVPISIPPGIAGMAPDLSLVYSSQGSDGIAGQGWSLAGLSTITRCPRTRQQDGYGRPVTGDSLNPNDNPDHRSDGICLDGTKLLETGLGTYVSEKTDFSTIELDATGAFQVHTKAGETRYYGRLDVNRVAESVWLLDRVVDPWGNYFDVQYNNGHANAAVGDPNSAVASGLWASSIDYTGSLTRAECSGPSPSADCTFSSITFQYECRPDIRWTRFGSVRIPQSQRLKSITTAQGTYSLTYTVSSSSPASGVCPVGSGPSDSGVSKLHSIGYCAGTTCMKELTFDWKPDGDRTWNPSGYPLPSFVASGKALKGTQFVDIDGDGRPDFILARTNGKDGTPQIQTARNTGAGWDENGFNQANQAFPLYLSDQSDNPTTVRFADLDGDGRLDVMVESANVSCDQNNVCISCPVNKGCPNQEHYAPAIWLNRFGTGGGWQLQKTSFAGLAPFSLAGSTPTMLGDFDGDGKADLVNVTQTSAGSHFNTNVTIDFNRYPHGWIRQAVSLPASRLFSATDPPFKVADVNRDGLSDLTHEDFYYYADKTTASAETVLLNQGPTQPQGDTVGWTQFARSAPSNGSSVDTATRPPRLADLDGDGFYDLVDYVSITNAPWVFESVGFGDGTGYGVERGTGESQYVDVLDKFTPPVEGTGLQDEYFAYALLDIDGDGLVDLVRHHRPITGTFPAPRAGGEILLNNGQTWKSVSGHSAWQDDAGDWSVPFYVPSESTSYAGSAFIDLDGDGMPDAIQKEDVGLPGGAWKNPYQRPVIDHFPNGLAGPNIVSYVSTTSADAASTYADDDATDLSTKLLAIPVTVVSQVQADDKSGTGGQERTTYTYHSLRQDAYGRGPLGFHRVDILDDVSKVKTVTTYAQAYPYTGLPVRVDKFQRVDTETTQTFHQISQTNTIYCDTLAANPTPPLGCGPVSGQPFPSGLAGATFVYPSQVEDVAYLHPEADDTDHKVTTLSGFTFDENGNSKTATTTITKVERDPISGTDQTETFTKRVDNDYLGSAQALQGKPTRTTSSATGGTMNRSHTTTFDYAPVSTFGGLSSTSLALKMKHIEPGAAYQLDTAYRYDQFGNVQVATSCASDFNDCEAGASNPNSPGTATDPHPPFRTTTVTYDPAGRFPVQTTNAAGHTETTVYDPVLGVVLTRTGPNLIQTCYQHDALGRLTSQIERCNSPTPLVTTMQQFFVPQSICSDPPCSGSGFFVPTSAVMSVTTPPSGAPTWSYANDQGNNVGTLGYTFEGGFVETTTTYDPLGQVLKVAKPFHLQNLQDAGTPAYSQTIYDDYHRVWTVIDDLGVIDDSGTPTSTTSVTTYSGSTAKTERIVHAQVNGVTTSQTETRFETKNALGKIANVTTAMPDNTTATMSYSYDADGNLTVTSDPSSNQTLIGYDTRGRKISMLDPDMGSWGYVSDGFGDLVAQQTRRTRGSQ